MIDNSNPYLNKDNIRERMHNLAASLMGISPSELTDSTVNLFLDSLSEEICTLATQIDEMENRILDKLSSMLVFDINTIATPAHGLLHASSVESHQQITTHTAFNYLKNKEKISFYPVCNTRIYKGDIRYFIHQGLFYATDRSQTKTLQTRSGKKESFEANSFWIGLEIDPTITNIADLSFYIDFDTVYNKENLLNLLPYIHWKIQDRDVPMYKGIFSIEETYENQTLELFARYDYSNKINESIKESYQKHYLSVKGDFDISNSREHFPAKLHEAFPAHFKENFTQPLVWIEISCPESFTDDIIASIQVSINTFAVSNKELVSRTVDVTHLMPIIPLPTGSNESFISVSSLLDSKARQYFEVPITEKNTSNFGIYTLRCGGCERYNKGEAQQYLTSMLETLKEKASAFFGEKNGTKTDLKNLEADVNLIIRDLDVSLSGIQDKYEITNYILLETDMSDKELFFVEYWLTQAARGNNIKAGSPLTCNSDLQINRASLAMMSTTKGGRTAVQRPQRYAMYQQTMTRNRLLVSNEDIERFCLDHFQDSISEVSIRRGLIEDPNPNIGFLQTTDVYLKPHSWMKLHLNESDKDGFQKILQQHSPFTFRYRVFISNT